MTPLAPAFASASAMPRPIPLPAPVTTAPLFAMSIVELLRAHHKWLRGIGLAADPDRLGVHPLPEGIDSSFTTETTALVAAERSCGAADPVGVDPDCAGLQTFGRTQRTSHVRG